MKPNTSGRLLMPNRLIRDGLLESEAVLSLPVEARWLYVSILLSADDIGLFEATEFHLSRKADVSRATVGKLLQMLVDADLVRLYSGPGMRQLGFIPRFRQRLQIQRSRLPAPPAALYADDEDAARKFNDLAAKKAVETRGQPKSADGQPPEPNLNLTKPHQKQNQNTSAPAPPSPVADLMALPKWSKEQSLRVLEEAGVCPQVARSWMAIRKPLTPIAWGRIKAQAQVAGMDVASAVSEAASRGWMGFDASWLNGKGTKSSPVKSLSGMNYDEGADEHGNLS